MYQRYAFLLLVMFTLCLTSCTPEEEEGSIDQPSNSAPAPTPDSAPEDPYASTTLTYPTIATHYEPLSNIGTISPTSSIALNLLSNFRSSPSLPPGVYLDADTGDLTGNAYTLWDATAYTVSADRPNGIVTISLPLGFFASGQSAIDPTSTIPRNFAYQERDVVYRVGHPIEPNIPMHQGAVASSYSQSYLQTSAGINFDTTSGIVSGTPTSAVPRTEAYITMTVNGVGYDTSFFYQVLASAPDNLTYTTHSAVYPRHSAIATNIPSTIGGDVIYYTVEPTLPAGLSLDMWNGYITGTPSSLTPSAEYTVKANNHDGFSSRVLTIEIGETAPAGLNYSSNQARYTTNASIPTNSPSFGQGGIATSFSITPDLPTGLSLDTTSGGITGTPTLTSASSSYTVTASNGYGSTTKAITIVVVDPGPKTIYTTDGTNIKGYSVDVVNGEPIDQGTTLASNVVSKLIFHPTLDCAFGYSASSMNAFSINKSSLGAISSVNSAGGLGGVVSFGMTSDGAYIFALNDTDPTTQTVSRYSVNSSTCALTHLGNTSVHSSNDAFSKDMAILGSHLYVLTFTSKIKHYSIDSAGNLSYIDSTDMVLHANPPSASLALGSGLNLRAHGNYIYATDNMKAIESFSVNPTTGSLTHSSSMVNSGTYYTKAPALDVSTGFIFSNYLSSSSAGVTSLRLVANGTIGAATIEGNDVATSFNGPQAIGVHASESGTYVYTWFSYPGRSGSVRFKLDTVTGRLTKLGDGLVGQISGY